MPLPDADKRSPRVYTLSQNTDLENLAFATMQSIGNPINIEELNEDELRRLVLVNLARLSVKGEWDGLLTAGGGGGGGGYITAINAALDSSGTDYDRFPASNFHTNGVASSTCKHYTTFLPFIAPKSGDVTEIGLRQTSTGAITLYGGIYSSSDTTNAPYELLTYGTFDASIGTGAVYDASPTGTATLVAGTQYWIAFTSNSTTTGVGLDMVNTYYLPVLWPVKWPLDNAGYRSTLQTVATTTTSLAASFDVDDLRPSDFNSQIPQFTIKIG